MAFPRCRAARMSQVGLILQFSDLTFDQKSATTQANQFTAAAHPWRLDGASR
jgi:hypothetical protein